MSTKKQGASTEASRFKVQSQPQRSDTRPTKPQPPKGKPPTAMNTAPLGRRASSSSILETQIPKPSTTFSKFVPGERISNRSDVKVKVNVKPDVPENVLQRRRASDPGPEIRGTGGPQIESKAKASRRASDLGVLFSDKKQHSKQQRRNSDTDFDEAALKYTEVHCTWCQRKGRKAKGHFYCHDCQIGLCERCAMDHVKEVTINRHSVSVISKTYSVSPNQGPFPDLTQIGSIKLDQEVAIRGSAFLPSGVLLLADFTNSKIRMFTGDYTRKHVASLALQKENRFGIRIVLFNL